MKPKLEPFETQTCECCGGAVNKYKATFCFEVWREFTVEAPDDKTAGRMFCDIADNLSMDVPNDWQYGYLQVYDNDGDQFYER